LTPILEQDVQKSILQLKFVLGKYRADELELDIESLRDLTFAVISLLQAQRQNAAPSVCDSSASFLSSNPTTNDIITLFRPYVVSPFQQATVIAASHAWWAVSCFTQGTQSVVLVL
jgi:hypothetical protein